MVGSDILERPERLGQHLDIASSIRVTNPKFHSVHIPEAFHERDVFFREMALIHEGFSGVWDLFAVQYYVIE